MLVPVYYWMLIEPFEYNSSCTYTYTLLAYALIIYYLFHLHLLDDSYWGYTKVQSVASFLLVLSVCSPCLT
jgi:hypothetical protein